METHRQQCFHGRTPKNEIIRYPYNLKRFRKTSFDITGGRTQLYQVLEFS